MCAYLNELRDLNNQNTLVEIYNGSDFALKSSIPFCIEFRKSSKTRNYLFEFWKGWRHLFLAKETAKHKEWEKRKALRKWEGSSEIRGTYFGIVLIGHTKKLWLYFEDHGELPKELKQEDSIASALKVSDSSVKDWWG